MGAEKKCVCSAMGPCLYHHWNPEESPLPASPPEVDQVPVGSLWSSNGGTWFGTVKRRDGNRVFWNDDPDGWLTVSMWLDHYHRLPDAPAPEAVCCEHGRYPNPCWECAGDPQPAICDNLIGDHCTACDRTAGHRPGCLWLRKPAPEAKAAVCGHVWMGTKGFGRKCALPEGHDGSHRVSDADADRIVRGEPPQPTPPPAPAPYACAPGCTPLAPCLKRNSDGDDGCPAWFERDIDGNMSFYRRSGIEPDLPPARSYPAGELSFTGGGATACRMTGRR